MRLKNGKRESHLINQSRRLLTSPYIYRDTEAQRIIDKDSIGIPLYLHYEDVASNFVKIVLLISTESIPVERRPLLAVYLENFFATPVVRDGVRIEFEQVVAELEKDTVDYYINSASGMDAGENIKINFRVEPEKYEVAIKWLRELMWDSVFDEKVPDIIPIGIISGDLLT